MDAKTLRAAELDWRSPLFIATDLESIYGRSRTWFVQRFGPRSLVNLNEAHVLDTLQELGEASPRLLVELTLIPRTTLSAALRRLEARGEIVGTGYGKARRYRVALDNWQPA